MTRQVLADHADFVDANYSFQLRDNPFPGEVIHPGPYRMGKAVEDANTYRVGHPLAQKLIDRAKTLPSPCREVTFELTGGGKNIAILNPLVGQRGSLSLSRLSVSALEDEDALVFASHTDAGQELDDDQCRRLFDLSATVGQATEPTPLQTERLAAAVARKRQSTLDAMTTRNGRWFDVEMDKLDRWAEDRRTSLRVELEKADEALKTAKKAARTAPTLPEKLERQREVRKLDSKRDEAWRAFDSASRELDARKDALLDDIAKRLEQRSQSESIFTLRWHVV